MNGSNDFIYMKELNGKCLPKDVHESALNTKYSQLSKVAAVKNSGGITSSYMCYTAEQIEQAKKLKMMQANQHERDSIRSANITRSAWSSQQKLLASVAKMRITKHQRILKESETMTPG